MYESWFAVCQSTLQYKFVHSLIRIFVKIRNSLTMEHTFQSLYSPRWSTLSKSQCTNSHIRNQDVRYSQS
jgi:hypothetical protein